MFIMFFRDINRRSTVALNRIIFDFKYRILGLEHFGARESRDYYRTFIS